MLILKKSFLFSQNAVIKVIGVGGGGGNAVEHMLEGNIEIEKI